MIRLSYILSYKARKYVEQGRIRASSGAKNEIIDRSDLINLKFALLGYSDIGLIGRVVFSW